MSNWHALALKNRGCFEFTVLIIYFLSFRIFEQLAVSLKNGVALKFFTVLKYFLSFRIFEQLALALKTEFALKFFETGGAAAPPDSYACDHHHTPLPLTRGRSLSVVHVVFV